MVTERQAAVTLADVGTPAAASIAGHPLRRGSAGVLRAVDV